MSFTKLIFWRHPWVRHLRLSFNLMLSPIFLWGIFVAGGTVRHGKVGLGYLSLHLFLYGGTTAFNSYYDKDEGPIGGMARPPPVDRGLLWFSVVIQLLGLPLAAACGFSFALAWMALLIIATAYSHPAIRLKANPWLAFIAVGLGQGAVGFLAGWLLVKPSFSTLLSFDVSVGAATTALLVAGLYIVTQSYQWKDDAARGDRTLPVILGPAVALRWAVGVLGLGGALMIGELGRRVGWVSAGGLAGFFILLGAGLLNWSNRLDCDDVMGNFRISMRFAAVSSVVLTIFLLFYLF